MIAWLERWLGEQLLASVILVIRANRLISRAIADLEGAGSYSGGEYDDVEAADLEREFQAEKDRREIIEEKAKVNVVAVTLAFSVMFAGVGIMTTQTNLSTFEGSSTTVS